MSPPRARIELWVEERDGTAAVNPVMRTLLEDLADGGHEVSVRIPEQEITDAARSFDGRDPDLVLLKTDTTFGLSRAISDEACGVRFLNNAHATLCAHDKAATVARLAAAGLPVPETFLLQPGEEPLSLPGEEVEWVLKPTRGVHGRGVTVHRGLVPAFVAPAELGADGSFVVDDGTRLLQRRIGGEEPDVKVYVADGRCFAATKRFSASSYATDDIEHLDLYRETEDAVLAAGEALKLRCFGVDLRLDDGRPVIIDANPFPGYRGFLEAVEALRAEVERALEAACR